VKTERLEFKNEEGAALSGILDLPADESPAAYAVFAHCFTCSKHFKAAAYVSRALAAQGIATLRFDFTGLGESEGDFAETSFTSNVDDLVTAAEFLETEYDAPSLLVGHSFGGAAVLRAAAKIESVRAVATINAPAEPSHVERAFESRRAELEERGEIEVSIGGRTFTIRKQFVDDLDATRMNEAIAGLGRALMILHAPLDDVVGVENAAHIFEAAKHPKSFVSLDHADHLLSDERDARYAGSVIAAWARKYLDIPDARSSEAKDGDGWITARTGDSGYYTEVRAGGHNLVADEPEDFGGTDLGPSPYEYLSASLATCTGMTLRMYADRKQWPLRGVTVRVRHQKVHAEDCQDCDTKSGKVDELIRKVRVEGDLSDEQRQRLLEIADKCPVHRSLTGEIRVRTELAE
jgi:putative redox protein